MQGSSDGSYNENGGYDDYNGYDDYDDCEDYDIPLASGYFRSIPYLVTEA